MNLATNSAKLMSLLVGLNGTSTCQDAAGILMDLQFNSDQSSCQSNWALPSTIVTDRVSLSSGTTSWAFDHNSSLLLGKACVCKEKLRALHKLEADWDGFGASPPLPEAISDAISFVNQWGSDLSIPIPQVGALASGEAILNWHHGQYVGMLEFDGSNSVSVYVGSRKAPTLSAVLPLSSASAMRSLIDTLKEVFDAPAELS